MGVQILPTLVAACLLTTGIAAAAPPAAVDCRGAIELALEHNNGLKAAAYDLEAARQGKSIASSAYYPGIAFEESFQSSNSPTRTFMMKLDEGRFTSNDFLPSRLNSPGSYHDFQSTFSVTQTLYDPAISARRDMAASVAGRQEQSLATVRQEIAFQVFRTYLDVSRCTARLAAAEQALKEAQEHLRLAGVRREAGVGLRSDELRAATHRSVMEQQLLAARNDLTLARLQLGQLTGRADGDMITTTAGVPTLQPPAGLEQLVGQALENRSDFLAARADLERSTGGVRLANSAFLPTLGASASYQLNSHDTPFGSDNNAWGAGISLKWQLFDGMRSYRERDKALAEQSAAGERVAQWRRDIRLQLQESLMRREEAVSRRESARLALQDAEEAVRLIATRFENSLATMVELLDAQTALNQARAGLADADAEYTLSAGRVYHRAGLFLKEIMK